jgi:uncharacterized protein
MRRGLRSGPEHGRFAEVLRMLAVAVTALAIGATALLALTWWAQERMVFQPPARMPVGGSAAGDTRIDYDAADGQQLFGFLVGEIRSSPGVLIAFHGNADLAVVQLPWAGQVHARTGWSVLLAEYRGYGGLDGRPTAAGVRKDAIAAYEAALASGGDPARVALYGHSLGSAIAAELAADVAGGQPTDQVGPFCALLLESPFTSARDMAARVGPSGSLLFRMGLARFGWDTEARVARLDAPVAVAHGARDGVVPVAMGRRVHAAAAVPGPLLIIAAAGHNDVAWQGGDEYWRWVAQALACGEL